MAGPHATTKHRRSRHSLRGRHRVFALAGLDLDHTNYL